MWATCCAVLCGCRGREMSELRAHLAEEKGTMEAIKREMANTEERSHKQVRTASDWGA